MDTEPTITPDLEPTITPDLEPTPDLVPRGWSRRLVAGGALFVYVGALFAAVGFGRWLGIGVLAGLVIGAAALGGWLLAGSLRRVEVRALARRGKGVVDAAAARKPHADRLVAATRTRVETHGSAFVKAARERAVKASEQGRSAATAALAEARKARAAAAQARPASDEWRVRQALQLNRSGTSHRRAGALDEAVAAHEQALTIFRELGDRRGEALTLSNLALALATTDPDAAVGRCEEARSILQSLDDAHSEGQVLANLGALHNRAGRTDQAVDCWRAALERLDPASPEHGRMAERVRLAS
jgi:tetratricopeptide (TPR) repeat protein